MGQINYRKLTEIFTDTLHHEIVAEIIRSHSTNKLDIRNMALDGLQLQNSKIALDLGCGFGFFTRALISRLNTDAIVQGLDFCAKYRTPYLESCKIAGLRGKFSVQDENAIMNIPSNSVDLVICSYALYFFPEIIPEISRILKPSGIFVIITHSENHLNEVVSIINDVFDTLKIKKPGLLPCQNLISKFNGNNGYGLLLSWFDQVNRKEFHNYLYFESRDFKELEKYIRFKQPYYIPTRIDDRIILLQKLINRLHKYLETGNSLRITKDDTIFVCKEPLYGK